MINNKSKEAEEEAYDVAQGKSAPVAPWHYGAVQVWLSWRHVQNKRGASLDLEDFAADCSTTLVRVISILTGRTKKQHHLGTVHKWAVEISTAWRERGTPHSMWIIGRPDGTIGASPRKNDWKVR